MPNDSASPNREGFDLSGMAETALKVQPGLDLEETPQDATAREAAAAETAAQKAVEEGARAQETDEQREAREAEEARATAEEKAGEETPEQKAEREADEARAAEEAAAKETADEKAAREAKEAEDAAAEAAKKDDPDADLTKKAQEVEPHTSKKTRATIEFFRAEAKKARELARTEAQNRAKIEKDLAEAAEKAKTTVAPKELTDEVARLRAVVQELDATRDPEIVARYDRPIEQNTNAVVGILKQFSYHKNEDGTDNPNAIPNLLKGGLTLNNPELRRVIEAMEKNDAHDEAQSIKDAISDNRRLSREKITAIDGIKAQVGDRIAQRKQSQEAASQDFDRETITQAGPILGAELDALKKEFSYMVRPADPLPTDSAEVAKAKREQIAEFTKAEEQIGALAKSFSTQGKNRADDIKARASLAAHAILAATLKIRVVPKLKADLKARDAKIAKLEADLAKHRKASDLTRAHGAAVGGSAKQPAAIPSNLPTGDAMAEFARSQGIEVNS